MAAKKSAAKKAGVVAKQVNLGHVMALRPRVSKSFRPADFKEAKERLAEESWPTIEEAARAVATKALELTNEPAAKQGRKRRM